MDAEMKVEQAKIFKDKGTQFFKENKFELAANKYRKIVDFLEHELSLKGEIEEERKGLLLAGRLNLAMCLLKQVGAFIGILLPNKTFFHFVLVSKR